MGKDEVYYIYVGSMAGYNGGGAAKSFSDSFGNTHAFGAGGGATDIRCFVNAYNKCAADSNLAWNSVLGLKSRIMVAGGGASGSPTDGNGAVGGGLNGVSSYLANGGTQIGGYLFGIGNYAAGGGYYGGNGYYIRGGGTGGGSGFVSGCIGCNAIDATGAHTEQPNHYSGKVFTNIVMQDGASSMPTFNGTTTMVGNSSNGYAKITYIGRTLD